ncbi:zinc-dependent metalloprotease family protein [Nocardioides mangrovi]|uniref:Fibronectin type-III domain-containing protein n=1 Tax=Nocardioides mangrovi TaxID=2874580 RepID=A0ABS7U964_9ACTN|nr:zinc-dependent metalloprotease family protein [Nocardioides mangrovi]MBZ5737491.1 hypothetical protein [Nocardioides mangrovi]
MRRPTPHLLTLTALGALACVGALLPVVTTQAAPRPAVADGWRAPVHLSSSVTGRDALAALRDRSAVADTAAANGMTSAGLAELLRSDDTAWLDTSGRLFYRDTARYPARSAARAATTQDLPFPASDAFSLHSDPGSQRTLYLNFTGGTVTGTQWNKESGRSTLTATPYDIDGDSSSFSTAERNLVQQAWLRVSEDYAPFDIDVTTEPPTNAQLVRSSPSDQVYGMEAMITGSATIESAVCGGVGVTGVAYVGVFGEVGDDYLPAWVCAHSFSDLLNVSESVSHEVGHTFGLQHWGSATAEYYAGQGGWAPIMGSGAQPIIQWTNGWYSGSRTFTDDGTQDDVAVIARNAPYRTDEAGDTVGTAAALTGGTAVIGRRTDVDVWSLGACSGATTIDAEPAAYSPDLDVQLTLLDASGSTVATVDPTSSKVSALVASGMNAVLARTLSAGDYYVAVDGVGRGSRTTGYDDYGSLGSYTLSVTGCDAVPTDPTETPTVTPTVDPTETPTVAPGPPSTPAAPAVRRGARGGKRTILASWAKPGTTDPITGYQVRIYRVVSGVPRVSATYSVQPSWRTGVEIKVRTGTWKLAVRARNAYGASAFGPLSKGVKGR